LGWEWDIPLWFVVLAVLVAAIVVVTPLMIGVMIAHWVARRNGSQRRIARWSGWSIAGLSLLILPLAWLLGSSVGFDGLLSAYVLTALMLAVILGRRGRKNGASGPHVLA
jgi:hypothetical protein